MHNVERLFAHRAPFHEVMAAIDACEAMPDAAPLYLPGIQAYRVTALARHERPDDELITAIDRLAELDDSLLYFATSVVAACSKRASLAARFLPSLIAKLETAIAAGHDEPLDETLATARQVCERLGVPISG